MTTKTTNSRTVKSRYIAFNTNPIYPTIRTGFLPHC